MARLSAKEAERFLEAWYATPAVKTPYIIEPGELVRVCAKQGIMLGIVTSRYAKTMRRWNLDGFAFVQTSDQAPFEKDDPRCFAQPLDRFARAGILGTQGNPLERNRPYQ